MAKKDDQSFVEQQQELEAKKKLKEAQKQKPKKEKAQKPEKKKRNTRRWLRDFRGETKKITWPDFKTVMKSTGIVLVCIIVVGSLVWIVDFALTNSIAFARDVAQGQQEEEPTPGPGVPDVDLPGFEAPAIPDGLPEAGNDANDNDNDADANDDANDNDTAEEATEPATEAAATTAPAEENQAQTPEENNEE